MEVQILFLIKGAVGKRNYSTASIDTVDAPSGNR